MRAHSRSKFEAAADRRVEICLLILLVAGLVLPYVLLMPLTGGPARFLELAQPLAAWLLVRGVTTPHEHDRAAAVHAS